MDVGCSISIHSFGSVGTLHSMSCEDVCWRIPILQLDYGKLLVPSGKCNIFSTKTSYRPCSRLDYFSWVVKVNINITWHWIVYDFGLSHQGRNNSICVCMYATSLDRFSIPPPCEGSDARSQQGFFLKKRDLRNQGMFAIRRHPQLRRLALLSKDIHTNKIKHKIIITAHT